MPIVNGNRLVSPISLNDVNSLLGTSYDDVGKLIRNANFALWAKYKPFSMAGKYSGVTDNDVIAGNCGLVSPTISSTIEETKSKTWTYNRPTGGSSSPYRLHDFNGYYDDADINDKYSANKTVNLPNDASGNVIISTTVTHSDYSIGIEDISALSDYYLAIEINYTDYSGNTINRFMTSSEKIGNGSNSITIPVNYLPILSDGETYQYYVFASATSQTPFAVSGSGQYYPLPFNDVDEMKGTITIHGNLEPD